MSQRQPPRQLEDAEKDLKAAEAARFLDSQNQSTALSQKAALATARIAGPVHHHQSRYARV